MTVIIGLKSPPPPIDQATYSYYPKEFCYLCAGEIFRDAAPAHELTLFGGSGNKQHYHLSCAPALPPCAFNVSDQVEVNRWHYLYHNLECLRGQQGVVREVKLNTYWRTWSVRVVCVDGSWFWMQQEHLQVI